MSEYNETHVDDYGDAFFSLLMQGRIGDNQESM